MVERRSWQDTQSIFMTHLLLDLGPTFKPIEADPQSLVLPTNSGVVSDSAPAPQLPAAKIDRFYLPTSPYYVDVYDPYKVGGATIMVGRLYDNGRPVNIDDFTEHPYLIRDMFNHMGRPWTRAGQTWEPPVYTTKGSLMIFYSSLGQALDAESNSQLTNYLAETFGLSLVVIGDLLRQLFSPGRAPGLI